MAQCVIVNPEGSLQVSAADPCTSFVMLTPVEYGVLSTNPLNLSPEDGALTAAAVGAVWLLAWSLRAIRSALNTDGDNSTN